MAKARAVQALALMVPSTQNSVKAASGDIVALAFRPALPALRSAQGRL